MSVIKCTHVMSYNVCNSSSRRYDTLFWPPQTKTYAEAKQPMHKIRHDSRKRKQWSRNRSKGSGREPWERWGCPERG